MGLRLKNSSGNYVELNAPSSIATDFGLTLPVNDGDSGQYLQTNGTGTLSWQTVTVPTVEWTDYGQQNFTVGGSSETVTGISTNARFIRIVFAQMSVNNTATPQMRLRMGNGSESATGYDYATSYMGLVQGNTNQGNIHLIHTDFNNATNVWDGIIDIASSQTNMVVTWIFRGPGQRVSGAGKWTGGAAIDRINLNTASQFDNGHFAVYSMD